MKIVILDGERTNPGDLSWEPIASLGELTVWPHTAPEDMISRIADNEIVIVDKPLITRAILEACPSIRMVTLFATGFNTIDVEAAREKGIPVCNVPGYSSHAVSQLADRGLATRNELREILNLAPLPAPYGDQIPARGE